VLAAALEAKHAGDIQRQFGAEVLDEQVSESTIQARAEMMLAVDDGVGRLVVALEEHALLENTLLVFMSDNGSFFGEHGLSVERRFPYEESIKSPLVISHRAAIEPMRIDAFALSVDIAPTLMQAAGVEIPRSVQGRSLLPHALGKQTRGREAFLLEYYGHENPFPWIANIDYRAVRLGRYKYIRWIREDEAHELYDLETDPFELRNLAADPAHATVVARAHTTLTSLVLASLGLPVTQPL
jgi:arylsulfatase A-like enzyme